MLTTQDIILKCFISWLLYNINGNIRTVSIVVVKHCRNLISLMSTPLFIDGIEHRSSATLRDAVQRMMFTEPFSCSVCFFNNTVLWMMISMILLGLCFRFLCVNTFPLCTSSFMFYFNIFPSQWHSHQEIKSISKCYKFIWTYAAYWSYVVN